VHGPAVSAPPCGIILISMKRTLLIVAVAFICIITDAALWYVHHPVVLRLSDGFFPDTVRIQKNETVTFFDLSPRPMWPASSPHPKHTGYPAFDPQTLIHPWHAWSFTFTEDGAYPFHDHLAPQFVGVVTVGKNDLSKVADESTCTAIADAWQQESCMNLYFRNVTETKPYAQARAIYEDLAVRYPRSCHGFAHDLGKNAYHAYLDGSLPPIGQEASACAYGLWHGFTTAMQEERGFDSSKEFCASLTGATDELRTTNRMNCYHGIGIGLIPDPPSPELWGDFDGLVGPALDFCETVGGDPLYKERCQTGVFHAMTTYMVNDLYGLTFDEDSLGHCTTMTDPDRQYTCFITLVSAVPIFTRNDLEHTERILKRFSTSDFIYREMFINAAIMSVTVDEPAADLGAFVAHCEAIGGILRPICIRAVINNLFSNGTPGVEYRKVAEFCSGGWIREDEKTNCYSEIPSYAGRMYAPEKLGEACSAIPEEQRGRISDCPV
jgi:hypothetical protein